MGWRNFHFKLFTKDRRKSLEFSEIFAVINGMIFMFDHCWNNRKSFINIFYLHDFFPYSFHVILALDEVMAEVIIFGIRRSFFKYLMKNLLINRKTEIRALALLLMKLQKY